MDKDALPLPTVNVYDERYIAGYRTALSGYEIARWKALEHFFRKVVRPENPQKILDYGCGNGLFYPLFRSLFGNAELFGADVSSVALGQIRDAHPEIDGKTSLIDRDRTGFPDGFFDLVVSVEVLEHVEDLGGYLREIGRLLKKDGVFVWTTPCANPGSIEHIYAVVSRQCERSAIGKRRWKWEDPTHLRRMTSGEVQAELEKHGFHDARFRFRAHLFSFLGTRMFAKVRRGSRFFAGLMCLDYLLFRRLPNGASMMGMAKKL